MSLVIVAVVLLERGGIEQSDFFGPRRFEGRRYKAPRSVHIVDLLPDWRKLNRSRIAFAQFDFDLLTIERTAIVSKRLSTSIASCFDSPSLGRLIGLWSPKMASVGRFFE